MTGAEMFREYARVSGRTDECPEAEPFGDCEEMAQRLLGLILSGAKRATCWARMGEEPPRPGALSVVTDWAGEAGCIIETVRARVMPFSQADWALARLEGEDDCFESWREGHARFFTEEGAREGYAFSGDMEIIFEEFRVVWPMEFADEE